MTDLNALPCEVICRNSKGQELKTELRLCTLKDLLQILKLQELVLNRMPDKDQFVWTTDVEIEESLAEDYCVGAFHADRLVLFALMIKNRVSIRNLGYALGYDEEKLKKTVTYDTTFVDPDYRGYGLQYLAIGIMDSLAVKIQAAEALATISPENSYSLHNAKIKGFTVAAKKEMYGGYERFILRKVMDD